MIVSGPDDGATVTTEPAIFQFTASGIAILECQLDSAAFEPCVSPWALTGLAPGTHVFRVRARDEFGNVDPEPASRSFTITTVAAIDTILDQTPGDIVGPSDGLQFSFHSTDASATLQCRLDADAYQPCTSPYLAGALEPGDHEFNVRAVAADGTRDSSPAIFTFEIDDERPVAYYTLGPDAESSDLTPGFEFDATEEAIFECALDGASSEPCTSPFQISSDISEGDHALGVVAIDRAGNRSESPLEYVFNVDQTSPETVVTSSLLDGQTLVDGTFELSAEQDVDDSLTFECALDSAEFEPCEAVWSGVLPDGGHVLQMRAVDPAGNEDPTPFAVSVSIDSSAPAASIVSGPLDDAYVVDSSVTFGFEALGADLTECSFDEGAFAPCTSPVTMSGLADGLHSFQVRASDLAGHVEAMPERRDFIVDTESPETSIDDIRSPDQSFFTVIPSIPINSEMVDVFASSPSPNVAFECRFDAEAFKPCSDYLADLGNPEYGTSVSRMTLSDGPHSAEVRAVDAAGNSDPTPATLSFSVQSSIPNGFEPDTALYPASFYFEDGDTVEQSSISFWIDAQTFPVSFECSVDSASWEPCSSSFTPPQFANGPHSVSVRAIDRFGVADSSPASMSFVVSNQSGAATVILDTPPPVAVRGSSFTVEFHSESSGVSFQCRLDAGSWRSCQSPHTVELSTALAEGEHTFQVRSVLDGRVEDVGIASSFTLDRTAPTASFVDPPSAPSSSSSVEFSFASSETGGDFRCAIDGGSFSACPAEFTTPPLPDGIHAIALKAVDVAGNVSVATYYSFTVDTGSTPQTDALAPETEITGGPASGSASASSTATFSFEASEVATFECSIDSAVFASCASGFAEYSLADGAHAFAVRAIDGQGNVDATPATAAFEIDTALPDEPSFVQAPGSLSGGDADFVIGGSADQLLCKLQRRHLERVRLEPHAQRPAGRFAHTSNQESRPSWKRIDHRKHPLDLKRRATGGALDHLRR